MPAAIEAGTLVANMRVVRALGAGEMGDVYEAVSPEGSRVALKVLRRIAASQEEVAARFEREASIASATRHPNVIEILERGVHDGSPYLVMPLLEGEDLDACLTRTGPLRPEVAVAIARDAGRGLAAAHAAGVVHRDLKPANVFLDRREGPVRPIVCDFGVAKIFTGEALTASGAVLGTPLYMSLEQIVDSKRVDARCDVWALGMTLYHALAGRPALADVNSIADLLIALRESRVPPLQSFAPWVGPDLARVVHGALLPIERRFPSMRAFVDALDRFCPAPAVVVTGDLEPVSDTLKAAKSAAAELPRDARELSASDDATMPVSPAAVSIAAHPMLGRRLGDRYLLRARLGAGGMGAVFDAVDTRATEGEPTREVAIKVMLTHGADASTDAIRRFLREARASQRIASDHVARVLDTGVDAASGSPFIVMERLRGRDLAAILAEKAALEPEVAVALVMQACDGLRAAHALGIVHRDIKPSNLFVHEAGERAVLKVCDFGIAKQLFVEGSAEASADLTQTGGLLGSPLYMSPEQARSAKSVDQRSDVFSLCLSLHEALSGLRPWQGRTSMGEIILAVCTENVPELSVVAPWVPPALSAVVARGLARDASSRIQSVAELADALRPFAASGALASADIRAVSPSRRETPIAEVAVGVGTASAVSVPARRPAPKTRRTAVIAASAAAVVAGAVAVLASRSPVTSSAAPSPTTSPPTAAASVTSVASAPAPSSSPTATSSESAKPVTSAAIPRPKPVVVVARPSATASATASSAPPAKPASSVGRGVTATDLPPGGP